MSSTKNILEMFETIMESDMNGEDKLTMIKSLNDLRNSTTEEAELAHDYVEATTPKETFKVTMKRKEAPGMVYGHKRWATDDRKELFSIVKETFGAYSTWKGKVTPGSVNFELALEQLAEHFSRTPLAIKSQIRDVVQPCANEKNQKSIRIAKQAAFEAGLIDSELLEA
jgi:hypothetical protein